MYNIITLYCIDNLVTNTVYYDRHTPPLLRNRFHRQGTNTKQSNSFLQILFTVLVISSESENDTYVQCYVSPVYRNHLSQLISENVSCKNLFNYIRELQKKCLMFSDYCRKKLLLIFDESYKIGVLSSLLDYGDIVIMEYS